MHDTKAPTIRRHVAFLIIAAAALASVSPQTAAGTEISVVGIDGKNVGLEQLIDGRPALLVFWATWCGPCRAEIPRITEVHRRFNDEGLAVLALNPGIRDSLRNVRRYVDHFQLQYPVYFDANQATRSAFKLIGTPTIILLDANGKEIQRGETVDLKAIERLMKSGQKKLETGN